MTISTLVIQSGPYAGTGTTDTFAYTFRILAKEDLVVVETDSLGVKTTLVVDTDYTVTGVGADAGGNAVRVAGNLPTGSTWLITRDTPQTQTIDYGSQAAFLPQTWEDGLDKLTMQVQEAAEDLKRAIKSPTTEVTVDLLLPLVASRASQLLEFDAAGLPVTNINAIAAAAAVSSALATGVAISADTFTGDGTTTAFVISVAAAAVNGLLITIDGVVQQPTADYTLAGTTVTFTTAPINLTKIVIRNLGNASSVINVNQRGQETLAIGTAIVTLPITPPDANYRVALGGDSNETFFWSGKSTTGFTINSSNAGSTAKVDWLVAH